MTNNETSYKPEFTSENDEQFMLYESENKLEKIFLFRSIEQQLEYILLSPCLVAQCEVQNLLGSNILFFEQYHMLLLHKRNIQLYLITEDKLSLFHRFFGMTTTEFFDSISDDV